MIKHIFLILCGENEQQRPRSNQLLSLLKNHKDYKIIVSGSSSFTIDPESSESSRLSDYLISNGIEKSDIIMEDRSMDTLWNIVFSHIIVEELLQTYTYIDTITLITDTFHLHRSQILFTRIFRSLLNKYKVKSYFIGTEDKSISTLSWKQQLKHFLMKLTVQWLMQDITIYRRSLVNKGEIYAREQAILELVLADFVIFRLSTFSQFKNYLYSLPVYNTIYQAKKKINITASVYSKAINYMMKLRNTQVVTALKETITTTIKKIKPPIEQ